MRDRITTLQIELLKLLEEQQKKQKEYIRIFDNLDSQTNKYMLEDIADRQKEIIKIESKIKRFRRVN